VLAGTGLAIATLWHAPAGVYVGTAVLAPGLALQYPALIASCLDAAPAEQRSAVIASFSVFVDVSQGIGLPLLGVIVALTDERGAFGTGALLCFAALFVLHRFVRESSGEHATDVVAIGPLEPEV
jgi:MFS family permease